MIPVATLLVGAAGGYISGQGSSSGTTDSVAQDAPMRARPTGRSESSNSSETSKRNRAASADQIVRMAGNSTRIQALMDFYGGLSSEQLAEEVGKLEGMPMSERIMASFLLFGHWAEVDPTSAMSFSNSMGFAGAFVRPTILQSWASTDPVNAAKYYGENPREFSMMGMMGGRGGPMGGGQNGASIIATEWARQDPAAAMAWAATLTTEKNEAMNSVIREITKTDPAKAVAMLSQIDEAKRPAAYASIASEYGASDFSGAQAWIRSLPANQQAGALAAAIGGLSHSDPVQAAKELAAMPPGDEKDGLIPDIVGSLAKINPQAAADLLKQQDNEGALRDSMRQLMPAWAGQNPAAALAFVNSYEPGDVRDSAAQAYLWSDRTGSPADQIKLAETITDEGDRSRTVGMTAMRWMREDPVAAKDYIASSTVLSDEAKQRQSEGGNLWGGDRRGGGNRGLRGGGGN
jgi:hypothetical protein